MVYLNQRYNNYVLFCINLIFALCIAQVEMLALCSKEETVRFGSCNSQKCYSRLKDGAQGLGTSVVTSNYVGIVTVSSKYIIQADSDQIFIFEILETLKEKR